MIKISLTQTQIKDFIEILECHDQDTDWLAEIVPQLVSRFHNALERSKHHNSFLHKMGYERYIHKKGLEKYEMLTKQEAKNEI